MDQRKIKVILLVFTVVVLVGMLITATVLLLVKDDNSNPPNNDQNESNIATNIIYANDVIVPNVYLSLDETNAVVSFDVIPSNATVLPSFQIESGNSVSLNNKNISPISYGTTTVKYTIAKSRTENITGTFEITVVDIQLTTNNDMKCGQKANGLYDTQTLSVQSNIAFDEDEDNYEVDKSTSVINLTKTNISADKKIITYTYNLTNTTGYIEFEYLGITETINLTATSYVNNMNCQTEISPNDDNIYVLYLINTPNINKATARTNNHFCDTTLLVELSNSLAGYSVQTSNSNISYNNETKMLSAISVGNCDITLTANDGSNYYKVLQFEVKHVPVQLSTSIDNATLNKDNNETLTFDTIITPNYAINKTISYEISNANLKYENNIFTPLSYGTSTISVLLNGVKQKDINVIIEGNNLLDCKYSGTDTNLPTSFTNDSSLRFDISVHNWLNESLDISSVDVEITGLTYEQQNYANAFEITFTQTGTATMRVFSTDLSVEKIYTITVE